MSRRSALVVHLAVLLSCIGGFSQGLRAAELWQALGERLPLDLIVVDEAGREQPLSALVQPGPLLILPVYYTCPNLCSLSLDYLSRSIAALPESLRSNLTVAVLSIDPLDTPGRAAGRRLLLSRKLPPGGSLAHWHFLTAPLRTITQTLAQLGIPFIYDQASGEYNHPSVAVMLDQGGTIRQYIFGLDFPPNELRQAYALASARTSGSLVTRFLIACFHFDPASSRYGHEISLGLRTCALLSLAGVGSMLLWLGRRRPGQRPPGGQVG